MGGRGKERESERGREGGREREITNENTKYMARIKYRLLVVLPSLYLQTTI